MKVVLRGMTGDVLLTINDKGSELVIEHRGDGILLPVVQEDEAGEASTPEPPRNVVPLPRALGEMNYKRVAAYVKKHGPCTSDEALEHFQQMYPNLTKWQMAGFLAHCTKHKKIRRCPDKRWAA